VGGFKQPQFNTTNILVGVRTTKRTNKLKTKIHESRRPLREEIRLLRVICSFGLGCFVVRR
jgi:hypothetical protein